MIHIERFINQLLSSNCFLVVDDQVGCCMCIDPASEQSKNEIKYITDNNLVLDYILLTHEHIDHTWGTNALLNAFPQAKVICSKKCQDNIPHDAQLFYQLYHDEMNYEYNLKQIDFTTEELDNAMNWHGHNVRFIDTPGHSPGSVCISIGDLLFGGDTLIPYKPFIVKRKGGSKELLAESISKIKNLFSSNTKVYPGHGDLFELGEIDGFINSVRL